ncbi:MAG: AAA family ATPase [Sphingobacteriales bacterium JAD_PAG50586_3]|nr:MAG: AAA family ATPase [Sphingobacteriales bacterium JAD_PAG50586_3]
MELSELNLVDTKKKELLVFLNEVSESIAFLSNDNGIKSHLKPEKETFHTTSTAFCLYYLSTASISFDNRKPLTYISKEVNKLIEKHYPQLLENFSSNHKDRIETEVGVLPNNYNTPIQICGALISYQKLKKTDGLIEYKEQIKSLLFGEEGIAKGLLSDGFISRIGHQSIPSAYHTYWVLQSVILYDEVFGDDHSKMYRNTVYKWLTDTIAKQISYSYSSLPQLFDVIEASYLTLSYLLIFSNDSSHDINISYADSKKMVEHLFKLIFDNHFQNGVFSKSLPVFSNSKNYSVSCPTIEPIALLIAKGPFLFLEYGDLLDNIFKWINENKISTNKANSYCWRSEWEHFSSKPSSFMSTCAITFLLSYRSYLESKLSSEAAKALGVTPLTKNSFIDAYKYPGSLGKIVSELIVAPIKEGNKNLAHYSMVLYGPPGTSKTTISKKISQDLDWPLLIINSSYFIRFGFDKIDSEAEKVFRLLSYLKNTVVLFDEVEELVLNRDGQHMVSDKDSRMLTTSMLPRINDLRNIEKIVFLFATNHIGSIDGAIRRSGRFDFIQCVLPPTKSERKLILKELCVKYKLPNIIQELLIEDYISNTERFCYSDLKDLVKKITLKYFNSKIKLDEGELVLRSIEDKSHGVISEIELGKFKKAKKEFDRG